MTKRRHFFCSKLVLHAESLEQAQTWRRLLILDPNFLNYHPRVAIRKPVVEHTNSGSYDMVYVAIHVLQQDSEAVLDLLGSFAFLKGSPIARYHYQRFEYNV